MPFSGKIFIYVIRLEGSLSAQWSDWFDGMAIAYDTEGNTTLTGPVADQAALYGLLSRFSDLGLQLNSVTSAGVSDRVAHRKCDNSGLGQEHPMLQQETTREKKREISGSED